VVKAGARTRAGAAVNARLSPGEGVGGGSFCFGRDLCLPANGV
jgi:hypothetical protein